MSYEPAPIEVSQILRDLEMRRWEAPESDGDEASSKAEGATLQALAAFALAHNPTLASARAQIGVSRALLVEAGLFPEPEIGWDAMDALAAGIQGDRATSVEYLAGFGVSIPLLRPDERSARRGAAAWRIQEARRRVTEAEWRLVRDVHVAGEDVLEAQELLDQNVRLTEIAATTREYFQRARDTGAATAIQANLAAGQLLAIRAERVRLEARLRDARHRLNALLGLSPSTEIPVVASSDPPDPLPDEPAALAEMAVERRPDLAALLAVHEAAEEEVRLEVARQFPLVSIGTGIAFTPGLFSRFNRPAIDTALARRAKVAREIAARVHEIRREVHDALASFQEIRRELGFLESRVLPNGEESLRLTSEAFDAGEVTLLEILTIQRSLVDSRTRHTEVRAESMRRLWKLHAATGTLLPADGSPTTPSTEQPTDSP